MQAIFLGIDVGTTKVKSVLFDENGRELKLARRNTAPKCSSDGSMLQDMYLMWDMVAETIAEVIQNITDYGEIKAIGITAQGDGLWLIDKAGKPLADAMLWTDGRAAPYISKWQDQSILGASGRVVFAGSPLALSAWNYDHCQSIMDQAKNFLFCKDWIKYCLTNTISTDRTDLSDASLISVRTRDYDYGLLDMFGVPKLKNLLPPIRPSHEIIGTVTPEAAAKTGLKAGIPVINGMIDVAAAAIGNGVINSMDACSIIGTTVYNEIVVDNLDIIGHPDGKTASTICHALEDRWLLTLGTMVGTPNLDWFIREFYSNICDLATIEQSLKKIGPGSGGIIFHPYLGQGGERAPFVKPSAAAQFFGLKIHHTREHMLRSVYEGIAYSMKDCYEHFPVLPNTIRLAGGGSNSEFWCQMFASCVGLPVQIMEGNEIGARGAAIAAAVGSGSFSSYQDAINQMVHVNKTYEPIDAEFQIYDENYELYKDLYTDVWNAWDKRESLWKSETALCERKVKP